MEDDDVMGLLEPGVEIEGKMRFEAGLVRINSHFKGQIECEGTVVVAEQGEVEAEIKTRIISIAGKVKGSIHATERLEIKGQGVVLGDINTPSLIVEPGGYFDGQCHMPTPEPQKPAADDRGSKEHA